MAVGHIGASHTRRRTQRFLRKKTCDDAARALRGGGRTVSSSPLPHLRASRCAGLILIASSPSLIAEDGLHVPDTVVLPLFVEHCHCVRRSI